jgi:hypothetical protein
MHEVSGMLTNVAPDSRVYAELPSGEVLVPGQAEQCAGPDAYGICPIEDPAARPCKGATWRYAGPRGWSFQMVEDTSLCPVILLDPLGPLPIPQD